jgi:hypothetical protein
MLTNKFGPHTHQPPDNRTEAKEMNRNGCKGVFNVESLDVFKEVIYTQKKLRAVWDISSS